MMTEARWLSSADPLELLRHVLGVDPGDDVPRAESFPRALASDRKLRLFACACYRGLAPYCDHPTADETVRLAQLYAEGVVGWGRLSPVRRRLGERWQRAEPAWEAASPAERARLTPERTVGFLAWEIASPVAGRAAYNAASRASFGLWYVKTPGAPWDGEAQRAMLAERHRLADVLRDVVGNPFRRATIPPEALAANDGAAVAIARAIQEDGDWRRMPILGDALEDGGCDDASVLAHCRDGGVHVRGCWVVDMVTAAAAWPVR